MASSQPPSSAAFASANAAREAFAIEYRLRSHDGSYRCVLDSGRAQFDGGRFAGYVGSVVDITQRKQAELDTQRDREQLELLSDTVPALIEAGIDAHLVKPVEIQELGRLLIALAPARAV